jgi:hypothetical protein
MPLHRHRLDLQGARAVRTRTLGAFLRLGNEAVALLGIMVATGRPGTGKTFAALSLCQQLDDWVYVAVDHGMSSHRFLHRLLGALRGRKPDPELRGHLLEAEVLGELEKRRPVLVIDDANFLGRQLIGQFIFLQANADFALLLVGHRLDVLLRRYEELETRVSRTVAFRRIARKDLATTLGAYHDLFARTQPSVLHEIDDHYAKGNFRRWAGVLQVALAHHPEQLEDGIPGALVPLLIGRLSGGPYGVPDEGAA